MASRGMRVLVVFQRPEILQIIRFFLRGHFNVDIIKADSLSQATLALSNAQEKIEIVVCEYSELAKQITEFAEAHQLNISFLYSISVVPPTSVLIRKTVKLFFCEKTG